MKAVLLGNAFLDFFVFALGWSGTISPIGIPAAVGGKPFFSEVLTPAVTDLLTGPNVPATAGAFAVRTFAAMVLFHGLVRLNAWAHFRERGARTAAVWSYLCELAFYALEIFAWGSQPLFVNNASMVDETLAVQQSAEIEPFRNARFKAPRFSGRICNICCGADWVFKRDCCHVVVTTTQFSHHYN